MREDSVPGGCADAADVLLVAVEYSSYHKAIQLLSIVIAHQSQSYRIQYIVHTDRPLAQPPRSNDILPYSHFA